MVHLAGKLGAVRQAVRQVISTDRQKVYRTVSRMEQPKGQNREAVTNRVPERRVQAMRQETVLPPARQTNRKGRAHSGSKEVATSRGKGAIQERIGSIRQHAGLAT